MQKFRTGRTWCEFDSPTQSAFKSQNLAYWSTDELLVGRPPLIHSYVENSKIRYTNSRLVLHISIPNNLQYQRNLHWSKSHPTMNTWQDFQSIDEQVHEQKQMLHSHWDLRETLKLDSPDMSPSNGKKVGSVSPDFWVIINQPHFVSDQSPVFHCSSSKIRDSKLIRFCTIRTSEGICIIVSIILENISRRRYFQKKKWSKLTLENPSIISIAIFLG